MSKNTSCDKQCIINHGSNDVTNNAAIVVIVDENKNNTSNKKTNKGNAFLTPFFIFIIMHLMVISFQLGNVNEEGNNDAIIPKMVGGNKDVNNGSKKIDSNLLLKNLAALC